MQKDYKEKKEGKEENAQAKRYDKEPPKMPLSLFCVWVLGTKLIFSSLYGKHFTG